MLSSHEICRLFWCRLSRLSLSLCLLSFSDCVDFVSTFCHLSVSSVTALTTVSRFCSRVVCNNLLLLLSFSYSIRMMMRLLFDSVMHHGHRFVKLYVPRVCLALYPLSTSLVAFLDFSAQLWNSASLLLAAVHCPSLKNARTMSVCVLFCQLMFFSGVEYSVLSHFLSGRAL